MKNISSDALNNVEPNEFGNQTHTLNIYDGLSSPFSEDVITLSERHISQLRDFVVQAAENYIFEKTLVFEEFGVPALVVRVDCTVDGQGNIIPYELEDSPSGQGITDILHKATGAVGVRQSILEHYERVISDVPSVIISPARNHGTDDKLIVGEHKYFGPEVSASIIHNGPVIVKAIPGSTDSHMQFMPLQSQAVAPLATEGDKEYAAKIGIYQRISSSEDLRRTDDNELKSQVIKACIGSMAMGVSIYLAQEDRQRFGKQGTVTAARFERDFNEYKSRFGSVLLQKFAPPIQFANKENRTNAIMRVFSLLNRKDKTIEADIIGGCYVARRELIVHGASNAVNGAVLV